MPDRPMNPNLIDEINRIRQRLYTLERNRVKVDLPDGMIDVFDEGTLEARVNGLNFVGAFVDAQVDGDRATVTVAGTPNAFDAIVDGTLAASDPDTLQFLGIGEACVYLDSLGLESINIFVRNDHTNYSSSSNLAYTETADFNCPSVVRLWGGRGGVPGTSQPQEQTGIQWNLNGFRPLAAGAAFSPPDFYIDNFAEISMGLFTTTPFRGLRLVDCGYASGNNTAPSVALCSDLRASNCVFDLACNGTYRLASNICVLEECDGVSRQVSGGALVTIFGAAEFYAYGCHWGGGTSGGSSTVTLPAHFDVEFDFNGGRSGLTYGNLAFTVPSGATGRLSCRATSTSYSVSATSSFESLVLEGTFGALTLSGAHDSLFIIEGHNPGASWDIKGPAVLLTTVEGTGKFIFRDRPVVGAISADDLTSSSGTFLDFIACSRSNLSIGAQPAGTSGTFKPYAFDGSSNRNVLVFHGATVAASWPAAGTDGGVENRVLPEGTSAWSGVSGHVVEDEGTPLTQRGTMNFVGAGVTAADSGGKTVVTIPGGGSVSEPSVSDWMGW